MEIAASQVGDSGVETECDNESNDSSSMSSMSAGVAQETGRGNNEELSSPQNSPLPPPPPPPSPPQQQTIDTSGPPTSYRHQAAQAVAHAAVSSAFATVGQLPNAVKQQQQCPQCPTAMESDMSGAGSQQLQSEDGYLGDCSSDGGNEKNFPLPADWNISPSSSSCPCHPSRLSLPPSPLQPAQIDISPPLRSPPPYNNMDDVEPPAGLQFSALAPSSAGQGGNQMESGGLGYHILSATEQAYGQRNLRTKLRGVRSKYNAHVTDDWSKIKTAISERKLRSAANTNNCELVEGLCQKGINVKCFDEHKRTPLHFAAASGYTEVTDILLKYGADPNQKDKLGNTALHLAACTNHVPVVTLLLRAGTDLTTIDNNGRTPMQLAQAKLKILQRSSSTLKEMSKVKGEVSAVLDMMKEYLKKVLQARDTARSETSEACSQLIDSFSQRLNLHTSHTDLSTDLGNLLQSLGSLHLKD